MKKLFYRLYLLLIIIGFSSVSFAVAQVTPTASGSNFNGFEIAHQLSRGDMDMRNARWEDAIMTYDNVIAQSPYWAPAYIKRATAKYKMGRKTEAKHDMAYAWRLSSNSTRLFSDNNFGDRLDLLLSLIHI